MREFIDALETILDALDDPAAVAPMIAQFELAFLAELGFGLDLSACAATGATDDLIYVSPRSGRAVSRAAGEAYRDKLMRLPDFLRAENVPASVADVTDAFALTGFFSIAERFRRGGFHCRMPAPALLRPFLFTMANRANPFAA